jgi:hypothetical protein
MGDQTRAAERFGAPKCADSPSSGFLCTDASHISFPELAGVK